MKKIVILFGMLPILWQAFESCAKRNFYPDPDHPGLSRLTNYGFGVATAYINGVAFINPFSVINGNSQPNIRLIGSGGPVDTLCIGWDIVHNDSAQTSDFNYSGITLEIPVSDTFSQKNFLALSDQRIDSNHAAIQTYGFYQPFEPSGGVNIYFVSLTLQETPYGKAYYCSGLFYGTIMNSTVISDGRFDFIFYAYDLNF